jgi:hypothetical protein
MVFAVIGDYGTGDAHEAAVEALVASWQPQFVVSLGDNHYSSAGGEGASRYDRSVGRYYGRWIERSLMGGSGEASRNAFFPCLGNHDYAGVFSGSSWYLDYFNLPGTQFSSSSGNERYYDFVQGDVHFFALNSNSEEPDGKSSGSRQAAWLKAELSRTTSRFNVVYDHHPPYSSDMRHGSTPQLQWPFGAWGADLVLSGHSHDYERVMRDGTTYVVNGLGGANRYRFDRPVRGSLVRYNMDWGAQRITVRGSVMTCEFFDVRGQLVDRFDVHARRQ